jgi:hypothetical protein
MFASINDSYTLTQPVIEHMQNDSWVIVDPALLMLKTYPNSRSVPIWQHTSNGVDISNNLLFQTIQFNNPLDYLYSRLFTNFTPGTQLHLTLFVKLVDTTNFVISITNTQIWNTQLGSVGQEYTPKSHGLNSETYTKIVFPFVVPATGGVDLVIGNSGLPLNYLNKQSLGKVNIYGF